MCTHRHKHALHKKNEKNMTCFTRNKKETMKLQKRYIYGHKRSLQYDTYPQINQFSTEP